MSFGSLSKDLFVRRTLNGSVVFFLLLCLYVSKFVLLGVLTHKEKTPENYGKTTARECKKSTSAWRSSLKKAHIAHLSFLSHMLTISSPSVSSNISAQDS